MIKSQKQYFWDYVKNNYPEAIEVSWIPGLELMFYPDKAAEEAEDGLGEKIYSCHRNGNGNLMISEDY